MKKILLICMAGLIAFVFTGTAFALDEEEDDIVKRHEKRMERLMAEQNKRPQVPRAEAKQDKEPSKSDELVSYGQAPQTKEEKSWVKSATKELAGQLGVKEKEVSFLGLSQWATNGGTWGDYAKPGDLRTCDMPSGYQLAFEVGGKLYLYRAYGIGGPGGIKEVPYFSTGIVSYAVLIPGEDGKGKKDERSIDKTVRENYGFVVDDLAKFLNADVDKIKIIGMEGISSMDFANKYNGSPIELAYGDYNYLEISFKYQGEVYEYGVKVYHYDGAKPGSAQAILDPAHTDGEMHSVGGIVPPTYGLIIGGELTERKSVEAQIELKGNGKNYTVTGQMADAPQQAVVPVQKKQ